MKKLITQINQSGLLCRGYGSLPIAIMFDSSLTIINKGLLCFFYACCGGSNKVVIKRDYIRACAGLSRSAYCANINRLIEAGFIVIKNKKIDRMFSAPNAYILKIDLQRYNDGNNNNYRVSTENRNDYIFARDNKLGVFCDGYCVIPRAVMEYGGLSINSKALYGYFLCCVANGTALTTSANTICNHLNIAQNAYLRAVAELTKNGLINVIQNNARKGQEGSYGFNEYRLIDKPTIPVINETN